MGYHLKIQAQNKKKTMIWTLTTMLKYPCSTFFSNYVQHFNDIRDTLFTWFECQRIKKIISCSSSMGYHLKIQEQNKKKKL